jgi:hypothetical protein
MKIIGEHVFNCDFLLLLYYPMPQSRERTQHIDGKNRKSEDDFQVYHIPTILNGKIENKNIEKVSNEVGYKNRENKKNRNLINTK